MITAICMAREIGISPKTFRAALREACFMWHCRYDKWTVVENSPEHEDMKRIGNLFLRR